jgi:voltage-gated potassium channel
MRRAAKWLRHLGRLPRAVGRALRVRVPPRLRLAVAAPVFFLAVGSVGYPVIEGPPWTWFDGLYMTAITLTTLGYGETHPLSTAGRVFTIFLAFGGIFTLFYFGTELVRTVVTGELRELLGRERMEHELTTLSGHLIVAGFGRMGKIVCHELEHQHKRYVVVDRDADAFADWEFKSGIRLHGDATEDDVLRKAGVLRAKALITVVGSDSDNLYITLSARLLNKDLVIVARAEEEDAEGKLRRVGANKVISPYLAGGHRAVQAALRPAVLHMMEMATRSEFHDLQIEEIRVEPGSRLAGKRITDCRLHQDYGTLIVGLFQADGTLRYNPPADTVIPPGATLVALGQRRHCGSDPRQLLHLVELPPR